MNRRHFLPGALGLGALAWLAPSRWITGTAKEEPTSPAQRRKLVLVQFGGGTRYSESMGDPQHRYIPPLWNELVPQGTLYANVRVEHRVVHPNSTASMLTGHWEWDDLDWSKPVVHPTLFEIYRRTTGVTDLKTWAFAYASILANAFFSSAEGYGPAFAPNVVEPPTIPRSTAEEMDQLMHIAAATGRDAPGREAARACAELARSTSRISLDGIRSAEARAFVAQQFDVWKQGTGSTSHDAFLAECAIACLKAFTPHLIAVCLGEIDCAHYGSWSRYVEAIARTDALTSKLWLTLQTLDAYRGQTLMLVLPDHGRELEESGGLGFVHHSDFYTNLGADEGCRHVWMLALGPGVAQGRTIAEPTPLTAVAPIALGFLGLRATPVPETP